MFISKVILNPYRSETQRLISNRNFIHGAIESGFNYDPSNRILWRLYTKNRDPEIYVISKEKPDFRHIVEKCGRDNSQSIVIKDYSSILDNINLNDQYQLQIEVNPVIKSRKDKKLVPLVAEEDIDSWIHRQGELNGFVVEGEILQQPQSPTVSFKKGHKVSARTVQIDGVVRVTEPEKFAKFAISGIGKQKAYGFGMPLIRKINK